MPPPSRPRGLRAHDPSRLGSTGARKVRIRRGGNGSRHPPPRDAAARPARAGASPERIGGRQSSERVDRERLGRGGGGGGEAPRRRGGELRGRAGRAGRGGGGRAGGGVG